MRRITRLAALAAGLAVAQLFSSAASAADYTWSNLAGGTTAWNNPTNWGGAGFPYAVGDKGDINVGLTGNLNVTLPSDFTLASLLLGSTASPVTTTIGTPGGGSLYFDNGTGGLSLFSRGVAGASNIVNSNIFISGSTTAGTTLSLGSAAEVDDPRANQRSLTINGNIQPIGFDRVISNNLRNGAVLTINGDIVLSGGADNVNVGAVGRRLTIAGVQAGSTVINGRFLAGTLPTASVTGGSGTITLSNTAQPSATLPLAEVQPHTFNLNADNSAFTGVVVVNRGTYVLNAPNALGTREIRGGNPGNYGFNFIAGSDNYAVNAEIRTVQNLTFRGTNSFVFNQIVYGTQNRALVNLLPEGKSMTMNKAYYTAANTGDSRISFFDGTGTTLLEGGAAGGIRNYYAGTTAIDDNAGNGGSVLQRGTGKLIVNGTGSTFRGFAMSSGGLLEFATPGSYGVQADNGTGNPNAGASAMFTNPGGAVGVRTGSLNPSFINLFTRDFPGAFGNFNDSAGNQVVSRGAIALGTADASTDINFGVGDFANDRVKNVSIGALSGGVVYTGTITPGADGTYRLGGGGTLTMANANALTGGRSLEVRNGGTVVLAQANDYSGPTTVQGNWIATGIESAQNSSGNIAHNYTVGTTAVVERTVRGVRIDPVLEVKQLSDTTGSSLAGTSAIRLHGGTLRYSGGTNDVTNKTITIGSVGGTLDSSGAGTINFASSGAATLEDQADITSVNGVAATTLATANNGTLNFGVNDPLLLANVGLDWTVAGPGIPTTATIKAIAFTQTTNPGSQTTLSLYLQNDSTTGFTAQAGGGQTYTFTNQSRTLTLTGSNNGNNTLANALGNSAKGTLGINKTGAGKWILSGNNTYTGATTVTAGTLGVGSVNALAGTASIAVKSGSTLAIATPLKCRSQDRQRQAHPRERLEARPAPRQAGARLHRCQPAVRNQGRHHQRLCRRLLDRQRHHHE